MVGNRCKILVEDVLGELGLHCVVVGLGEVEVMERITAEQREKLKELLLDCGLELLDDRREVLVEKIKKLIIEMVYHSEGAVKVTLSRYLSQKLNYDYTYLANLFSEIKGISIEQFIILHKVERVKELMLQEELNVSEIAWKMNYSSVAHLSNQFKKVTGLSPTQFKHLKGRNVIC